MPPWRRRIRFATTEALHRGGRSYARMSARHLGREKREKWNGCARGLTETPAYTPPIMENIAPALAIIPPVLANAGHDWFLITAGTSCSGYVVMFFVFLSFQERKGKVGDERREFVGFVWTPSSGMM